MLTKLNHLAIGVRLAVINGMLRALALAVDGALSGYGRVVLVPDMQHLFVHPSDAHDECMLTAVAN
ncbi:MAG: hypothetical protein Q8L65_04930 [Burkholderiales bacterium]|nr:hypothetical protein [Burkholderiales bacterium]MDP2399242.1 hypothetical protein [Burkholderiales bacterium]